MQQWTTKLWWTLIAAAAVTASLVTAYTMQRWWGVALVLVLVIGAAFGLRVLWARSATMRQQLVKTVHAPIQWTGQHKKPLLLAGMGTVSLVGLYSLWGGSEQARAAVEHLADSASLDAGSGEAVAIPAERLEAAAGELPGVNEAVWYSEDAVVLQGEDFAITGEETIAVADDGWSENNAETTRAVGSYGAVIPVIMAVSALRSLWKHGGEVSQGRLSPKEALRAVGVDMVGSGGRVALFAGGAQVAGLLVSGVPLIIAGGVLANLAGEPFLRRMQAVLKGDQGQLAQHNVQQKLEQTGKIFDQKQLLSRSLVNLEQFVKAAHAKNELPTPVQPSLRQLLFPNVADILDEELYKLRRDEKQQLDSFADELRKRLRDTLLRRDYRALGELLYLNRQVLLSGMESEMQRPLSQLDRALQRLAGAGRQLHLERSTGGLT